MIRHFVDENGRHWIEAKSEKGTLKVAIGKLEVDSTPGATEAKYFPPSASEVAEWIDCLGGIQ